MAKTPVTKAIEKLKDYEHRLHFIVMEIEDKPSNIEKLDLAKKLIQINLDKFASVKNRSL